MRVMGAGGLWGLWSRTCPLVLEGRLESPGSGLLENRVYEHPWPLGLNPPLCTSQWWGLALSPPPPKGGQMARKPGLARQSVASHCGSGACAVTPALGG